MSKRPFKPRQRQSGNRDATLIIIVTEGEKSERIYLEALHTDPRYRNSRVHVEILAQDNSTHSSPLAVIRTLDKFKGKYKLDKTDQLWMVIDVDHWDKHNKLTETAQLCQQKKYRLAVSKPCFEVWLWLHLCDPATCTPEKLEELSQTEKVGNDTYLEIEIGACLGKKYNKVKYDPVQFLDYVQEAIDRARALDTNPSDRWPQGLGTRVYQLVEAILESKRKN
ncbi:MAG: RloB family protein [Anaerolineae bacterium]|jgi:hypothetical protein|nr:RloB family protein [Anaerolineae bacterium]